MAKTPTLRIIPLGGLDGIGKNMTAFECGDDMILIDAGLMFPDDDQPGIDLVLPDYTYVLENEHKLRGIVITHGHEDHTGALPYLLMDLTKKVPIFASKMTLGLIEGKLAEHNIKSPKFREVTDGSNVNLGCFSVHFIAMTHSIPGAFSIFMKTPAGTVFHTGDFKLDQTPIDGVRPNYQAICKFAHQGIDLLLMDSTNANKPGFTPSEATVGPSLRHIIKNAPGRVFVASFSSQIHRIQQVCDIATAVGRKVVVTGRSMVTNTKIARELGYLKVAEEDILDAYELKDIPDDKIVVLCTGSQGEPLSALSRMANGEHRSLSIHEGDTVIISATPVPGNEKSVGGIINSLSKIGCDIYSKDNATVHVSGHGRQEELKLMLGMTSPRYFMPVHGEAVHLRANARLGESMGIPRDHIFIVDNGDSLQMRGGKVSVGPSVDSGIIYVDGLRIGDTDQVVLRDRKKLASDGIVTAVVTTSSKTGEILDVQLVSRGVSFDVTDDVIADAAARLKKSFGKRKSTKGGRDPEADRKLVRDSLSSYLWDTMHVRPMVIPFTMEV